MSGYVGSASYSSGTGTVGSFTLTVPAGTVSTDIVYLWVNVAANAARTVTCPGFTARLNDQAMGTFSRATLLEGTGHTAGDVLTITIAGGNTQTAAVIATYNGYTFDAVGAAAATASPMQVHGATSTQANDEVVIFASEVSGGTAAITAFSVGTIRINAAGGGSSRNFKLAVGDTTQATIGLGTTCSVTFSGSPAGVAGVQVALQPAAGGGGGGGGTGRKVNVGGTATASARNVNVGGVATAAVRKVNVGGVAT